MSLNTVTILGIKINSSSANSLLKEIIDFTSVQGQPKLIFTPNPEFLVAAHDDPEFKKILNEADINLPDGFGLVLASRVLGQPIKERVSGADVVERLLEKGNKKKWEVEGGKWAIGIAGARRGVQEEADELIKRLKEKYPRIRFVNLDFKFEARSTKSETNLSADRQDSNDKNSNDQNNLNFENLDIVSNFEFRISNFNLVLVCHGMGEQEKWIVENKDKIQSSVFMGVGGSLDFLTGFSKRAPIWIRALGFEWLWRGLQRPGHLRRVWRAVVEFGWLVMREKIRSTKSEILNKFKCSKFK